MQSSSTQVSNLEPPRASAICLGSGLAEVRAAKGSGTFEDVVCGTPLKDHEKE